MEGVLEEKIQEVLKLYSEGVLVLEAIRLVKEKKTALKSSQENNQNNYNTGR